MPTSAPNPLRGEILRLAHAGLDLNEFGRRAASALRRAIPFDGVAVVAFDPATALPIGEWADNALVGDAGARLLDIELSEPDVNKFSELAASGRPAASMSEATGGNLELSRRHRELKRPHGFGDELRSTCVAGSRAWGAIVLHRELGAPNFTPRDAELVASSSSEFAEAFQRMSLQRDLSTITTQPRHRDPGLLLLDDEDAIEMANATAAAWLDDLHDDGLPLPLAVTAVARRARAIAAGHSDVAATARVQTASGRWVLARGSILRNGTQARTAVTLTPARAPRARRAHRRRLRPHRTRATRHRARRARPAQRRDRRPTSPVHLHRPGPSESHLRETRRLKQRTARRQAVPRPLPGQRTPARPPPGRAPACRRRCPDRQSPIPGER